MRVIDCCGNQDLDNFVVFWEADSHIIYIDEGLGGKYWIHVDVDEDTSIQFHIHQMFFHMGNFFNSMSIKRR